MLMSAHARLDPGKCLVKTRPSDQSGPGSVRSLNGGQFVVPTPRIGSVVRHGNHRSTMKTKVQGASRYVTLTEGAEYLSVTEQTVRRYISDGKIQGYRLGKRALRVDRGDLDALLIPVPAARRGGASLR